MNPKLTSVVVRGDKITAYYKEEVELRVSRPTDEDSKHLSSFWKEGFEEIVHSWHGYGYGRKGKKWYHLDVLKRVVEREAEDPRRNKSFIIGQVVSEEEWYPGLLKEVNMK